MTAIPSELFSYQSPAQSLDSITWVWWIKVTGSTKLVLLHSDEDVRPPDLTELFVNVEIVTILTCSRFIPQLLQYLRSFIFDCERRKQDHCNSLDSWTVAMMVSNHVKPQGIWAFYKISNNPKSNSLLSPSQASQWHTEQSSYLRMLQLNCWYELMWSHKSEVIVSAAKPFWSVTLFMTDLVLQT